MRSLVLLSGGLDSTVLLAQQVARYGNADIEAISFDYGQRHRDELFAAYKVVQHYHVKHHVIELPLARHLVSSLTGHSDVPSGPYSDDNMSSTVVPNRNAIFLSIAAGIAASSGIGRVLAAMHAGDHAVYADCRPDFIDLVNRTTQLACGVAVVAPYVHLSKKQIVGIGRDHNVPFDLTWSCYRGGPYPCGECATCIERAEALAS